MKVRASAAFATLTIISVANAAALCVLEWFTNVDFGGVFLEILEMVIVSLFTQFSNDLIDLRCHLTSVVPASMTLVTKAESK